MHHLLNMPIMKPNHFGTLEQCPYRCSCALPVLKFQIIQQQTTVVLVYDVSGHCILAYETISWVISAPVAQHATINSQYIWNFGREVVNAHVLLLFMCSKLYNRCFGQNHFTIAHLSARPHYAYLQRCKFMLSSI